MGFRQYKTPVSKLRVFIFVFMILVCIKHTLYFSPFNNVNTVSSNTSSSSGIVQTPPKTVDIGKRLWPADDIMPTENVIEYFKNTLLIVMMSPSRYHLVNEIRKHYSIFFRHIVFCGPNTSTQYGTLIHGYYIVSGLEQYRAVSRILREYYMREDERSRSGKVRGMLKRGLDSDEAKGDDGFPIYNSTNDHYIDPETTKPTHTTPIKDLIDGMLFVSDDTILQPWAIAAKGYDKRIPWANQMGIWNLLIKYEPFMVVPGMTVDYHNQTLDGTGRNIHIEKWPVGRQRIIRLKKALSHAGDEFRSRLALAAQTTSPAVYIWSNYRTGNKTLDSEINVAYKNMLRRDPTNRPKHMKTSIIDQRTLKWSIFYTIIDSYYVPRPMWGEYCEAADLMAKHNVFLELAVPTILRSLHPTYEEMEIQYYWKDKETAVKCSRRMWNINKVDGFHRCRHDHEFVHAIFSNHSSRKKILNDKGVRYMVMNLSNLVPPV